MAEKLKERVEILQMAEAQGKTLKPEHRAELDAYRKQGLAKGGEGVGKPLPAWAANPYEKQIGIYGGLAGAVSGFQDDYAGNSLTGGLENTAQGLVSGIGTPGQRDWWANFRSNDNIIRNDLFGATLTPSEQASYRSTSITERMDPAEVRKNLTRRREIVRKALARKTAFLRAQGYDADAIDALAGEYAADFMDLAAKPDAPAAADDAGKVDIGLQTGIERTIDEAAGLKPEEEGLSVDVGAPSLTDEERAIADKLSDEDYAKWQRGELVVPGLRAPGDDKPPPNTPDPKDKERDTLGGAVNAAVRGFADVGTFGFRDEIKAAANTIFDGGTMADNLREQREMDRRDERVNPLARFGGQLAGGVALPYARGPVTAAQMARVGGGLGAAYGFGSGEGDLVDRGKNAALYGATGIAIGYGGAKAAPYLDSALTRVFRPSASRVEGADVRAAADRLEVTMLPADVGGVGTRMATGAFGRTLGGYPITEAAKQSVRQAGDARDRIAGTLGRVTDETGAGQAAQRGARAFETTSAQRGDDLYQAISVPPAAAAQLDNTRTALTEITRGLASNARLSKLWAENPRLQQTLDALTPDASGAGGQLSWEDLKRFRSIVGEISGKPSMADDGNAIAAMKKLYGALSEDMRATAAATSPRALTEFNRANQYWRGRENRIENVLVDIVGKNYQKGEADAFAQINGWAQKNSGDFKRLSAGIRSLPADEAATVRATLFGRMGQASPGQQAADGLEFSSAQFATQWQKLDDRAKSVLFPNKAHRESIDDLVKVTTAQKRAGQFTNFSNTALAGNAIFLSGAAWADPLTALAAAGGQFAVGKLLASPRFARLLSRPPRTQAGATEWMRQLSTVATKDPAIAAEVSQLQQVMSRALNDNSLTRAAASGDDPGAKE